MSGGESLPFLVTALRSSLMSAEERCADLRDENVALRRELAAARPAVRLVALASGRADFVPDPVPCRRGVYMRAHCAVARWLFRRTGLRFPND